MGYLYMSQEGYDKLRETLHQLETIERPMVIREIAEARDKGDLSENAEYHAAKEAQAHLEDKINQLKSQLANARVLDPSQIQTDEVQIFTRVRLLDVDTQVERTLQIVSESEANFKEGKISVTSPVAQGLLGKKVGDMAKIQVPIGLLTYEILEISL